MKFNLKTLRKAVFEIKDPIGIIEAFEGFEAELREVGDRRVTNECCKETYRNFIKEILGETS